MALSLNGQPKRLDEAGEKTSDNSKGYRYVVFNHMKLQADWRWRGCRGCRGYEYLIDEELRELLEHS